MTPQDRMLAKIADCDDSKLLKQWVKNGAEQGNDAIVRAARLRLYQVLPAAVPGTLEHEVWASIYALESLESEKQGKTIRLQRTRNSIGDVGEQACLERLLTKTTASKGFDLLVQYEMPDLLFEAVALRYPDRFSQIALETARNRLSSIGYTPIE